MTPEYEFKSKNRSFMTSRRLTEDHYAVSLPNPEKCAAGKRRIVKRQKILKSSIPPPPLDADALRRLTEAATRLEHLDDASSSLEEP